MAAKSSPNDHKGEELIVREVNPSSHLFTVCLDPSVDGVPTSNRQCLPTFLPGTRTSGEILQSIDLAFWKCVARREPRMTAVAGA